MARKKKGKKHHPPDPEHARKTASQIGSGDWWTPDRNKKNQIRIMPAWDERGICILRRALHYGFEEDNRNRAFPCLEDNETWLDAEPCPVCHVIKHMKKGDADERKAAEDLTPGSARFLVQLVDCKNPDKGVQKWGAPISFGRYFLSLLEDEDIEDITDPEEGHDIIVEVSGSGRGTKYDYRIRPKATEIPYEDWDEELDDLIEVTEVRDADELIELLEENYGNAYDIDKYLKDFDSSGKKGKRKSKKKKRKEEEEQESEGAHTIDEIKGMKRRALVKLVKDEDLNIDDDDWESVKELRELIIDELDLED